MAGRLAALAAVTLTIVAASTLLGPTRLRWAEIAAPLGDIFSARLTNAFWHLRVPRTCLAAVAGAGLAVGGVIFQALLRNPLAEPYTLGVASGASLAAAIGMLTGLTGYVGWLPVRVPLALAGAAAALGLVYLMARLRGGQDMTRLLLAGVCVSYLSAAGILLVTFIADGTVTNEIVIWLMGSLTYYRPLASLELAVPLLVVIAFAIYAGRALDLLALGEPVAASRGVPVRSLTWIAFILVGVLTAVIVANCGPIGFVGLMIPHFGRVLFGERTLPLTIAAALLGAAFLAVCDGVGRVALSGYEFPVGVITSIVGSAFFFYLLATRDVAVAR
jgi:iron complex transport system permease protein